MLEVYVIILNYKNWRDTMECLESLFRMQYSNFRAIVVDNNSGNGSLEQLIEWTVSGQGAGVTRSYAYYTAASFPASLEPFADLPSITFIQNNENGGFAKGNNLAIRALLRQDAYIWLLNPDITVQEDTLLQLVQFVSCRPFKTVTGCTMKNYDPPHDLLLYGGKINFNSATVSYITAVDDISQTDYVSGGALFTHTRHFNDIGLLPEDYFLYWEETDWCYQARQKGYNMDVCTGAVCYDKISTTIGRGYFAEYYYTRNGLIFLSKYKSEKIPLAYFFASMRWMKRVVTGRWDKAKGVYKGLLSFINGDRGESK